MSVSDRHERRGAPRYTMPNDQERREGRVATGYSEGHRTIKKAEIYDISHSGVSFKISEFAAPEIGEVVAVEFKLPGAGRSVAWYAQVIRIELEHIDLGENTHSTTLRVGTQFLNLPQFQKKQLEKMIDGLLHQAQKTGRHRAAILSEALNIVRSRDATYWKYWKMMLLLVVCTLIAFSFVSLMSQYGGKDLRGSTSHIWNQKNDLFLEQSQISPIRKSASEPE